MATMQPSDYEKLGVFYLGREYDLEKKTSADDLVLYDSKDLVTHAVVVGMTGSGKTGLCIDADRRGRHRRRPGDRHRPEGRPGEPAAHVSRPAARGLPPWVNEDDAARKGVTPDEYAAQQAERWKNGLADWGEDGARIQRLRDAADFAIYTPGSRRRPAGLGARARSPRRRRPSATMPSCCASASPTTVDEPARARWASTPIR